MFHVAVPTYRRPEWLARALRSLIKQGDTKWTAVVYDDSPDREGEEVVESFRDPRITYQANSRRLGAASNIDRCFGERMEGKKGFGLVVEDDNFLLPGFFARAADVFEETDTRVVLFNQRIYDEGQGLRPSSETTRGAWFEKGWIEYADLHASLLLMEGLSNGGIVWCLEDAPCLELGASFALTGLAEACRSLLVVEPIWFCADALAVWTNLPRAATAQAAEGHRMIGRGRQAITQHVLSRYGRGAVDRALRLASCPARRMKLTASLLHAGALKEAFWVGRREAISHFSLALKGVALRALISDPCADFLAKASGLRVMPDRA